MSTSTQTTATALPRIFVMESTVLKDPDPSATPEQVLALYAEHYELLLNAHVTGPVLKDDAIEYTFVTRFGTKGSETQKPHDFALMREVAYILCQESNGEQPEAAPSATLEPV